MLLRQIGLLPGAVLCLVPSGLVARQVLTETAYLYNSGHLSLWRELATLIIQMAVGYYVALLFPLSLPFKKWKRSEPAKAE